MPAKVCTCCICGNEVSKRQTLAFADGRACREHEEVVNFVESQRQALSEQRQKAKDKAEMDKVMKEINDRMRLFAIASYIQVQHSLHGHPVSRILSYLSIIHNQKVLDDAMELVNQTGGAYIDPDKLITEAVATMMVLNRK